MVKVRSALSFLLPIIGLAWLRARGLRISRRIASEVTMLRGMGLRGMGLRGMGTTPRRLSRAKR